MATPTMTSGRSRSCRATSASLRRMWR